MTNSVAQEIALALRKHGVEFVLAQSNPTALLIAVEDVGIRQLLYRTENAAGAMADAFSRMSGRVGVVAAQNGPAASLMVAPMAEALKASIPMLVLVQEVPASQRDKNAFQEFDHFALFGGVSKWTRRLDDPNRAAEMVEQAMVAANSGRPGPVVLLLARDMLLQPSVPVRTPANNDLGAFPLDRPRPETQAIKQAAKLLCEAKAPLIMAGGGVHIAGASTELAALSDIAHIPVATTNMGKGSIDETGPLSLGVAANLLGQDGPARPHLELISNADVVLLVGTRTNENGTDSWTLTDDKATYIHIDLDPAEIGRNYNSLRLLGDARSALSDLAVAMSTQDLSLRKKARAGLEERIAKGRIDHEASIRSVCRSSSTPILPQRIMAEIDELLMPDDIVVADASYSSVWVTGFLKAREGGQRFLTPRGLAGLGWGLPYAIGAKLGRPKANVIGVVGDGGFAHVWAEIEMAVREEIPITLIVLNNAQLAMQRHGENMGFDRSTTGIEFAPVDHAAIAKASGAEGVRISDPETIGKALSEALRSNKVTVLDILTDPNAYAPLRLFDGRQDLISRPPTAKTPTAAKETA